MAKIAVIDDVPVNRELLATVLKAFGHQVVEAADGAEALALVRRESPDLVICDILMPEVDGYEFVRQLRADPAIAATPVIFYTAYYLESEARQLAQTCGVVEILTKPGEPEDIVAVVRRVLDGARAASVTVTPPPEFDRRHLQLITGKLSEKVAELQGVNDKLEALIELNLQLASQRDSAQLLDHVCTAARQLIGAEYGSIAVRAAGSDELAYAGHCGIAPAILAAMGPVLLDGGVPGEVYRTQQVRRLELAGDGVAVEGFPPGYPPLHSLVAAPVVSLTNSYGWICLGNKLGEPGFSAADENLLRILAAQAGRIYENGSLYARVQAYAGVLEAEIVDRERAQRQLATQYRLYAVLSGINAAIVRIRERKALFREACRIAVQQGEFGIAWIGEFDAQAMEVVPVAWAGIEDDPGAEPLVLCGDGGTGEDAIGRAVLGRTPVVIDELSEVGAGGGRRAEALRRGYRSMVALPLVVESKVDGVIVLYAREAAFFTGEELDLLKELANDVSFALEYIGKQDLLAYLAYHDVLTGLSNRAHLQECLGQALQSACNHPDEKLGVVVWNIDRFRNINDTFGRVTGDRVLREVAQRLTAAWPGGGCVARIGGDHFAAIHAGGREVTAIAHAVENALAGVVRVPVMIDAQELRLSVSAGVAVFGGGDDDADTLVKNAEVALRKAKGAARGFLFYGPEMNALIADTLMLENRLRQALERDEFVLYYQPKTNGASGSVTGLEALIRWNDPAGGLVQPGVFIPVLEETGMILEVGAWAIRKALSDQRLWRAEGIDPPRIAVNVSAIQLRQKDFVESVRCALKDWNGGGAPVDLEITESMIMTDLEDNIVRLSEIRKLGLDIAIDDFGTGYSSLGYLAKLPVNALKIDKSFIDTMAATPESMTIVSTIISLAHSLDLKVIAEGVEREEQAKFLRLFRCNELQGYLISEPLPPDQVVGFLRQSGSGAWLQ